jgi:hypothetical protein
MKTVENVNNSRWPARGHPMRFIIGAAIAAIRVKMYYKSQGLSEEEATERALKLSVNMAKSFGADEKILKQYFKEMRDSCDKFIQILDKL